jgi:hypothetical protein
VELKDAVELVQRLLLVHGANADLEIRLDR